MVPEVECRIEECIEDGRGLSPQSITGEAEGDQGSVMRPDRAIVVREGVVDRLVPGQGPDTPAREHLGIEQNTRHPSGLLWAGHARPEEVARVRGDRWDPMLPTI